MSPARSFFIDPVTGRTMFQLSPEDETLDVASMADLPIAAPPPGGGDELEQDILRQIQRRQAESATMQRLTQAGGEADPTAENPLGALALALTSGAVGGLRGGTGGELATSVLDRLQKQRTSRLQALEKPDTTIKALQDLASLRARERMAQAQRNMMLAIANPKLAAAMAQAEAGAMQKGRQLTEAERHNLQMEDIQRKAAEARAAEAEARRKDAEARRKAAEAEAAARRAERKDAAQMRKDAAAAAAAERREKKVQMEIEKHVAKTTDLGEVLAQYAKIHSGLRLEDPSYDIPGFGKTATLPDFLVSSEGKDARQLVFGLRNIVLKARSGGAVTDGEASRMLQELGEGVFRNDYQLRNGLIRFGNRLKEVLLDREAALSPEAKEEFISRRGGLLSSRIPVTAISGGGASVEDKRKRLEMLRAKKAQSKAGAR